jgi:hypothetical protein
LIALAVEDIELVNRLEQAIIDRLQQLTELGAAVVTRPPQQASGSPVPRGLLSVSYVRSGFNRPRDRVVIDQEEELQFQIEWKLLDLRSHSEAYKLTRAAKLLLQGWCPFDSSLCGVGRFYCLGIELLEQTEAKYWPLLMLFGLKIEG